jgi:hypothetical protein
MMEIDMLDYFTLKIVNAFVAGSAIFLSIGIYPAPKGSPATSHRSRLESQEVKNYEKCNYWQARVDPSIKLPSDTVDLDETDEANTLEAWFEKVKEIGLQKAREEKLDPLNGVPVRWY